MYGVRCNFIHKGGEEEEERIEEGDSTNYREIVYEVRGIKESNLLRLLKNSH